MTRKWTFMALAISAAPNDTINSMQHHDLATVSLNPCKSDPMYGVRWLSYSYRVANNWEYTMSTELPC